MASIIVDTTVGSTNSTPISLATLNSKSLMEREIKDRALAQTKNYGLLFKLTEMATGANGILKNSPDPEWSLGEEPADYITYTTGAVNFSGGVNADVTLTITNYAQLAVGQLLHIFSRTTATPANVVEYIVRLSSVGSTCTAKILAERTSGTDTVTKQNVFNNTLNTTYAKILPASLGFNEVIPAGKFFYGKWIKNFMERMYYVIQEPTGTRQFIRQQNLSMAEQMRLAWRYFMQKYSNHLYTNDVAIGKGHVLGTTTLITSSDDYGITGGYDYFLRPDDTGMKDITNTELTDCKGFREIVSGDSIGMEDLENLAAKASLYTSGGKKVLIANQIMGRKILACMRSENIKIATEEMMLPQYPDISIEVKPIHTGFGTFNLVIDNSANGISKIIKDTATSRVSANKSWGMLLDTNAIGFDTLTSDRKFGGGVQDLRFLDVPANELGNQQDIKVLECIKSLYIKDPRTCGYFSTTEE